MVQNVLASQAKTKYVRMSPTKVRRVLNQIRGRSYEEALVLLEFLPYRACEPVWKIIKSAAANLIEQNNSKYINKQRLFIKEAFVTSGPILNRFRPRAQGRAYRIRKPTCHITVVVSFKK